MPVVAGSVLVAAVAGWLVGEPMRRRLNRLGYRLEPTAADLTDETSLPDPGPRRWVPWLLAIAWAGTVAAALWRSPLGGTGHKDLMATAPNPWWVGGCLALSTIGLWLAVIDLDVRRLPDQGQLALAVALLACGAGLAWGQPTHLLTGLAAGVACGLIFLILHAASRGQLGLGDVKLVLIAGWWLGCQSVTAVYAGLVAACLLGVAYALVTRVRTFAFGPWLVAGTLLATWLVR